MAAYDTVSVPVDHAVHSSEEDVVREQQSLGIYTRAKSTNSSNPPTPTEHDDKQDYGSFKDSLKAPIHRWFTYPAGYSHKFVEAKINQHGIGSGDIVGDPFLGTGTTSLAARMLGVHSIGVEAHRFVHWVAQTKLFLNHDLARLAEYTEEVITEARMLAKNAKYEDIWPDLIYKCFSDGNLQQLAALRQTIGDSDMNDESRDFLKLALTATLRVVTTAGAGWPYIAPSKYAERKVERHALIEFQTQCHKMLDDLHHVQEMAIPFSSHHVLLGDARHFDEYTGDESLDLVVTSPPYLNNYDYADRTRLETYFWGEMSSWADISREIRDHLVMAATTQVSMSALNGVRECPGIRSAAPDVHADLSEIIDRLTEMRAIKRGKKTYDYVVAGYFEDMLQVMQRTARAIKPGGRFVLVVGDSAPYGVHVATEHILGRLGLAIGFHTYDVEELRTRGGKWGHNPQRHKVPLRESVLTLIK